ncbi:GGDEF domain-containing protein [Actinoplanes sp. Pm04-4]|uniref:GGDEF domain-containing protein n=1 Tax=Paractinoplanes pyxinae TaxID=2997416 RepID=A0ABT4B6J8_9ACTN|nr:GGDEF domain-containing protein [Actinoplanes pyxinae]MCY1141238.1 GGDEF domain-containing protein [Actinoplanes pyxinae]
MADPVHVVGKLRRDPLLIGFVAWTALAGLLFFLLDGQPTAQVRVFWSFQPVMDLSLAMCSWRVARLATGAVRRFWLVMVALGLLFAVGDTVQSVLTYTPGHWTTNGGAVQTVCLGIGLTSVVVAMLAHPHPTRTGRERLGYWLDSATVLAAGGVVAWCLLATPGGYSQPRLLALIAAIGVCLTAAFAAIKMILSGNAPMHTAAALPMIGSALAMSLGMFLTSEPGVAAPPVVFLVAFLPTFLITAGPRVQFLLASADRTAAFSQRRRKPYSLLPYGAMVVAFGALIVVLPDGVNARLWGVVAGLVLICSLVAARQLVAFHDNTALIDRLREHEIRLRHQAHFDGLTGLANRTHFHDQVAHALAAPGAQVSVLLVDLDGFKAVNDTMGHAAGDALLMAVADRLRGAIRAGDLPARLGGDEFAALLPDCTAAEAVATAERILAALTVPEEIDGVPVRAAASIGVAAAGTGADVSSLLRDADLAMYAAKRQGKGTWQRHDPSVTTGSGR